MLLPSFPSIALPVLEYPYGYYYYTVQPVGKSYSFPMCPFMDSLSYSFLGYFSYSLALLMVSTVTGGRGGDVNCRSPPLHSKKVLFLSAMLFVLQDVLMYPVSLRGSKMASYSDRCITILKRHILRGKCLYLIFLGWFLGGLAIIYCFQKLDPEDGVVRMCRKCPCGGLFYFINMIFILSVTFLIGEYLYRNDKPFSFSVLFYLFT